MELLYFLSKSNVKSNVKSKKVAKQEDKSTKNINNGNISKVVKR